MKISVPLLFSIAYSAPGPNKEPENLDSSERVFETAPTADSTFCSDLSHDIMIVTEESFNNGQAGILTINKQSGYLSSPTMVGQCKQQIGQQCKSGVRIKWNMTFPLGNNGGYSPYFLRVIYLSDKGKTIYTPYYYGENTSSCCNGSKDFTLTNSSYVRIVMSGSQVYPPGTIKYEAKTQYSLHADAEIEWECLESDPEIGVTNTWQMAKAVLTNDFKPHMAQNYGCAGRGLFDAYGSTIGPITDYIDRTFLIWKKCVKCASDENEDNIVPYSYDAINDSCGDYIDTKQDFCECDRALMNVLKNAPADTGYSMYDQCVNPCQWPCKTQYVPLTCCKWNENFWAAYNPDNKCCSSTGVHQIGTCQ